MADSGIIAPMALPEVCAHHIDYDPVTSIAKTGTMGVNLLRKFRGDTTAVAGAVSDIDDHNLWQNDLSKRPDNAIVKELVKRSNLRLIEELQAEHKL